MTEELENKNEGLSAAHHEDNREGYKSADSNSYRNSEKPMRPRIRIQRNYAPARNFNKDEGGFRPEGFATNLQSDGGQPRQQGYRPRYNNGGQQGGYQSRGGYQPRQQGYRPRYNAEGEENGYQPRQQGYRPRYDAEGEAQGYQPRQGGYGQSRQQGYRPRYNAEGEAQGYQPPFSQETRGYLSL